MNGNKWMMLLGVLALATVLSLAAMKKMAAPLPPYEPPEASVAAGKNADHRVPKAPAPKPAAEDKSALNKVSSKDFDELWRKSLFQDDRTEAEEEAGDDGAEAGSQTQVNSEFELIGLACLGKGDTGTPVAIILQVRNERRNNRNNARRMGGTPPGRPGADTKNNQQNTGTAAAANPEERRVDKSLYRIGATIGTTGYKVKNIILAENKVVLERGGVETTLILDEKNTNNSIRRERVKNEAVAVQQKYKAQDNAAKNNTQQNNATQNNGPGGRNWQNANNRGGQQPPFGNRPNGWTGRRWGNQGNGNQDNGNQGNGNQGNGNQGNATSNGNTGTGFGGRFNRNGALPLPPERN